MRRSNLDNIGELVGGLGLWALILGLIYSAIKPVYEEIRDSNNIFDVLHHYAAILYAISVPIIILLVYCVIGLVKRGAELNAKCPHGIRAGATKGQCPDCVAERRRLDAEHEQALAERARKAELERQANELRKSEVDRLSKIVVPSLDELRALTPYQFETLVAGMFRRLGYDVKQTPASNDRGRDGIIRKGEAVLLFECKRYKEGGSSGRPDLQKFHSAIVTDNADGGYFITTGAFSREARAFADQLKERKITLVDPPRLLGMLHESNADVGGSQTYQTRCISCGAVVVHDLKSPSAVNCEQGHTVEPSITSEQVLYHLATQGLPARRRRRAR